ncbi:TPA: CDP-alcohol phosphatidyltransferase family protein [Candidatus Thalassarchaeaceae archaeon]|jgi:phosphatidylglycerophosphate synthase|nr:CDP-alcohol phosphatidyltransferase family protein [Euryarchaeota archaeon]MDG1548200.1 CDP-alcohol phosphatidyltransferase family protein [Candidatus Thalassarchaeaceae archaeon]DAC63481.1 MAG TPA: CDP-alcohol phosphatidyltransferase family protein [Candidatus Poseidoniales archaeon]MDG1553642.1 CDP-alcohol phosphatidyltransferase family protein [Candidatus Thalassarchaeaceae archaeon]DAC66204.1 MAG TPA: CDP-alcohol phosphatidyltransferase family protein [Candidatus Poseidoniales archaeon]
MFEKMRDTWTKAIQPIVLKLGNLDPSVLTWTSLLVSLVGFYVLAIAGMNTTGALMIVVAVILVLIAGVFDALDGALARHQGTDGPYGDFLDHTIDRIVDVGLLVAIGMNASFVSNPDAGLIAGLLTLLGSYMGTQAQSVGLDRIYGGFSRADRMIVTLLGLLIAAMQAYTGGSGIDIISYNEYLEYILLGNTELNGMTAALAVSAWGGVYTFLVRFNSTRKQLLEL